MAKGLSNRARLDLENHYSRLREKEEDGQEHYETALKRIESVFRPGQIDGPLGNALARAFEAVERAYHDDCDPITGEHEGHRPLTRRTLTSMLDNSEGNYPDNVGFSFAPLPLDDDIGTRKDADGFPLHVWHPGKKTWVAAKWDKRTGDLLDPDLSAWL